MPKFVFTSDTLPAKLPVRVRAAMWAESMKAIGSAFEMGIVASRTFRGEIAVLPLGKVQLGVANTVADGEVKVMRGDALIAADRDDRIMIIINRGGTQMTVRQFGRQVGLRNGEMAVLAMDIPSECSTPSSGASHVIMIPREVIGQSGQIIERYASMRLDVDRGAQMLMVTHVNDLLTTDHALDDDVANAAGDYIVSLAKKILALPGSNPEKQKNGQSDSRMIAARKIIAKNYRAPDFSPANLAKELKISARSVQNLLREYGTTFTAELTQVRLQAAYAALKSPNQKLTIADIALQSGFTELSTFYRAFRRQYGETPKAARQSKGAL